MKISHHVLGRHTDVCRDVRELHNLLDEVGLEVKRVEARPMLGRQDSIFDIEVLANRGDHYCYVGVARELHGRTGGGLRLPETTELSVGESPIDLRVLTDLCLSYTATLLDLGDQHSELPEEVFAPLEAAEIQRVLPFVDATNLANLEIGQPTHIFDADTIVGGISVRLSSAGETALPLFQEERIKLPEGTLVIADDEKILAIAGVIGCEESKATLTSRRLLLESAAFDPVCVRLASRKLDIRTDSSIRFERGCDPALPLAGAGRVVWLLETYCGAKRMGTTGLMSRWADPKLSIDLSPEAANEFLNVCLPVGEVRERLTRYGFKVEGEELLTVTVPPHRIWDVEFVADLYEELAKSIGYDHIPSAIPPLGMGTVPSHEEEVRKNVDELLVGEGFFEVFTDSFYGSDLASVVDVETDHPIGKHVSVRDAIEKGHSLLKNNALVQLVAGVGDNLRRSEEVVKMYEWTRTFHEDRTSDNGFCQERQLLAVVTCGLIHPRLWGLPGRETDVWYLKGIVNELAMALRIPFEVGSSDRHYPIGCCLHPARQATVLLHDDVVGILGEVHPEVLQRIGIKRKGSRPCYLEIESNSLNASPAASEYIDPPEQPYTRRDLAFTLPLHVEAAEVADILRKFGPEWLHKVDIVDCYQMPKPDEARALTFTLLWSNAERTRTTEELNAASEQLIREVEARLGHKGVSLR